MSEFALAYTKKVEEDPLKGRKINVRGCCQKAGDYDCCALEDLSGGEIHGGLENNFIESLDLGCLQKIFFSSIANMDSTPGYLGLVFALCFLSD